MFEALFGTEMPLAIRFFLAFLIVLGLIGLTAWAVRRFGAARLGGASMRGRQPRLSVIEQANVDGRRRLILVRRDNVEHLVMTGGPTDVVIESSIVRNATAREIAPARASLAIPEAAPRALALPDNSSGGSWPLQPEPAATHRPMPRAEPMEDEQVNWPAPPPRPEPAPRAPREPLSSLADEIAARPLPPRGRAAAGMGRAQPAAELRAEPRLPNVQSINDAEAVAADQNLAEMAHRLESALRKPRAVAEPREMRAAAPVVRVTPPSPPVAEPEPEPEPEADAAEQPVEAPSRPVRTPEIKATRNDAKPTQSKTFYDSLEQEMASLLGRPAGKT